MKKLENFLWTWFFYIAAAAFAIQIGFGISGGFGTSQAHELETDLEREFMRPDWLNDNFQVYYDDLEIYINDEHNPDGGMCYINQIGQVYINWELEERWTALAVGKDCMAHETGHWVDRQNGFPSLTEEFRTAIDLSAKIDAGIAGFPCITGKVCLDGEWGGYSEIYADLFERESIGDIPAILWDWYLPYYRVGGET